MRIPMKNDPFCVSVPMNYTEQVGPHHFLQMCRNSSFISKLDLQTRVILEVKLFQSRVELRWLMMYSVSN